MKCTGNINCPIHNEHITHSLKKDNKPSIGSPVVIDTDKGKIYGPFASWADAEWFSGRYSGGSWNIFNLTEPNNPHITLPYWDRNKTPYSDVPQYEWNGKAWMRT